MRVLYHVPHQGVTNAGRTIYAGYKNAFEDLGHRFSFLEAKDQQAVKFYHFLPDIFITSLNPYNLKYLDLNVVGRLKRGGMRVFVNVPFWNSPISKLRINETASLSKSNEYIELIKSGKLGDVYYNVCEQGDERMEGFEKETGYKHHTILLAADKITLKPEFDKRFKADISFVGTYLAAKKKFFSECVFPLKKKYDLRLYGQDFTLSDRFLGFAQKAGQYFNLPFLTTIRKPKLELNDEAKIYKSSVISINVHEEYQKEFGGDCNERTFKIPFCEGFEITDDVFCIRKYFREGEEIVIAKDKKDWFEKISYYIKNPEKRLEIIEAGKKRVLAEHTYHHRVNQMLEICKSLK